MPYRWLAEHYDTLFGPYRFGLDAAREHVLEPILPRVESACDLACGTGTTAVSMAGRGIKMFAVDGSPVMCRLARRKARTAGARIRVIHADMREFRLPESVDLITCEFDALNHVPQKADLALVAQAVARALKPGGYFFFDVNNRAGFKRYWQGSFWSEAPGVVAVMRNGNDAKNDKAWSDVEWFIREGTLWRRQQERVEEVCWSPAEMRGAGFDEIRAWDATPFFRNDPMIRPGFRTFYLAREAFRATRKRRAGDSGMSS